MLPLLKKQTELPNFINDFFGNDFLPKFDFQEQGFNTPCVNISEDKNKFDIELSAPGFVKKDFNIDLQNDILAISCKKEEEKKEKDKRYIKKEFIHTSFNRSFGLPDNVNTNKIKAYYKDGVLYVDIPKKEQEKEKLSKSIEIS
jgi:HSP20 family protein